jgi:hypothetical protein
MARTLTTFFLGGKFFLKKITEKQQVSHFDRFTAGFRPRPSRQNA